MATHVKRETLSDRIFEHIDSGIRKVKVIKETPSAAPISFTSYAGEIPFGSLDLLSLSAPDETNPAAEPLLVANFTEMCVKMTKRREAMPHARRHVDADEIFFIHRGTAKFYTEVGEVDGPAGRFVFITRGVAYRIVPETDDFMAVILESDEPVTITDSCAEAKLQFIEPDFPAVPPAAEGQTEWEERIITSSWAVSAVRSYDPIVTKQVIGTDKNVFAIDIDAVPAHSPLAPVPGVPFELFDSQYLHWDVSKRSDPLPWYHRNNRRNEVYFVHQGGGDMDSDLGYLTNPVGTFFVLPKGIEHSPMNRKDPLAILIWETYGDVTVNPEILKDQSGKLTQP